MSTFWFPFNFAGFMTFAKILTNNLESFILTTMVVNVSDMSSRLSALGLGEYEAKAYISLLRANPATAYEIARSSGIPTSKVYEALKRMVEKGIISSLDEEKKRRYIPIAPRELLDRHKASTLTLVDELSKELSEIRGSREASYIWNITDHDYLIERALRMISGAKSALLLSVWKDDFMLLEPALKEASRRKVRMAIVHFGNTLSNLKQIFIHPIEDTLYEEKGGRVMAMVTDSDEVLIGTIFSDNRVEAAWSNNRGFVTVTEDYIKHDIYIMKIVVRFDKALVKKFGERYAKLRDVFRDEEET
jgi:HTH-type transcriptional regulator, sugar sensing transcriptional regulator